MTSLSATSSLRLRRRRVDALSNPKAHSTEEGRAARLPANENSWRATGLELQVFADPTGTRARVVGGLGFVLVGATLAAIVIVATSSLGFSPLRGIILPTTRHQSPPASASAFVSGWDRGRHLAAWVQLSADHADPSDGLLRRNPRCTCR
jgi:hypothetical protein